MTNQNKDLKRDFNFQVKASSETKILFKEIQDMISKKYKTRLTAAQTLEIILSEYKKNFKSD